MSCEEYSLHDVPVKMYSGEIVQFMQRVWRRNRAAQDDGACPAVHMRRPMPPLSSLLRRENECSQRAETALLYQHPAKAHSLEARVQAN